MAEAIGVGEHEVEVVKGTKNEYEFRAELLSALFNSLQGEEVSFPASMVKDTEVYRRGILNALNVEYTNDDVKHTPVFRSKVIDGVKNMSGGGGGGGIPETATVTFTNNNRVSTAVRYVHVNPNTGELSAAQTNTISQGNSQTINRILVGSLLYSTVAGTNSTSTTGDITTTDKQSFHINGDGTITLG